MIYVIKYNLIIILFLIINPLLVISINSWFNIWINIELNLIIFIIYLILNNKNIFDIRIKYYLINAFRSSVFILIINLNLIYTLDLFKIIINLMILIKLGIVPFHLWFINIIMNLNWIRCLILSTVQKLIPLFILINIYNYYIIILRLILRGIFRIRGGFNQVSIKKIIAYSSLNHLNWILIGLIIRNFILLIYFLIYSLINISLIIIFNLINLYNINDLYKYKNLLILINFGFLSLGGLPPFFGFLSKLYRIIIIEDKLIIFIVILILFYSLNFIYYYIRLLYSILILNFYGLKFFKVLFIKFNIKLFIFMNIISIINLLIIRFWLF